jgi:hypothetical protein
MFYRYTDQYEADLIERTRRIEPAPGQTCKYYTPHRYDTGVDAQKYLAMAYTPTHRVGPIPEDELPQLHIPLRVVGAAYGQPGGGLEVATTDTIYLFNITPI